MTEAPSVAIVGIGGIFPDAPELDLFWNNIRSARSAAREVPAGRWLLGADAAFDPEPGKADRVYSRRGCFIDTIPKPVGPDLDPALLARLDPLFHLLVAAGSRAFADGVTEPLDRSRVGVIIGNLALPSEHSARLSRQWLGRTFDEATDRNVRRETTDPRNRYVAGLPAGILAQALGLGGGHCTLDAACASSLYAIRLAAEELLSGRADAMLTGGVSRPDPLFTQMGFSQLRALSRRGICSPFDAAGDGLVVGEGAGIFLLKRTADAVAHGDRIYGIIRAVGLANDVGGSLLAPLSEGQLRAMRSAYEQAGWSPTDVDLIECHATGTPVGDAVEFASLRELRGNDGDRPCIIGSVKSNIGHLLTAAGAAALTKVLLAMREKTLPPTANFASPPAGIDLAASPFRVLTAEERWERRGDGIPRRAAVSAFGFGGINAHLLVEEWLPKSARVPKRERQPRPEPIAIVGIDAKFGPWDSLPQLRERLFGGDQITVPTPPKDWWGTEKSEWFRNAGFPGTPFAGYWVDETAVAPDRFRIPPKELEEMLPQQLLMLETAAGAMADAGLDRDGNVKAGVFVGIALDLNSTNFSHRWEIDAEGSGNEVSRGSLKDAAGPSLTANRTMGALGSVVASRIAREFRAGGPSFTLSAEESSGIRALETAVRLLREGEIDRALVGAVDLAGDLRAVLGRHAVRPCSPSGASVPFDTAADGAVIGEGAAALVLKRLEDARRDGDRIYAVIRGIGDAGGRIGIPGKTAYRSALHRAYADAGVDPATVGYIEADAGGDPAADRTEAEALARFFAGPARSRAVGSVAAEIGSCGAASGLASLVRAALALHHETIPGLRNLAAPLEPLDGSGPLHLPRSPRYWLRNRSDGPRRAGVSVCSVDGSCSHVVLEGWEGNAAAAEPLIPIFMEELFTVGGETSAEIAGKLDLLRLAAEELPEERLALFAREWHGRSGAGESRLAMALVARSAGELGSLAALGKEIVAGKGDEIVPPALRDRIFYSPEPLGEDAKIAFVFPGSGNHFLGMGAELSFRRPDIFRRQDRENQRLKDQFRPELFWNGAPTSLVSDDHKGVIFGQVATGCAVSDAVRSFGIEPQGSIGYSLGESAGLFALRTWRSRDLMLERMEESTLFTDDLAGECRAARRSWGLGKNEKVDWLLGVVEAPAAAVRRALTGFPRAYLLIVNTPDECVVGGDSAQVRDVVASLGARFFPLEGVTTVHCEVAKEVAQPYHDLHLFETNPPEGVTYYSGARGSSYRVDRESAASSILAQALEGIDYPATIEAAYADGFRIFLEMGPGASCSRMIGRILVGRPHVARSACHAGQEPSASILRMVAQLVAERVPVDLSAVFAPLPAEPTPLPANAVRVKTGGERFIPAAQLQREEPAFNPTDRGDQPVAVAPPHAAPVVAAAAAPDDLGALLREMAAAQEARLQAHEAYLRFAEGMTRTMTEALALSISLEAAVGSDLPAAPAASLPAAPLAPAPPKRRIAFDREMCLEFARGSIGRMLGQLFAEADSFPTRVRLPDEPLMLVDRIVSLEGEPRSMTSGGVVTEHDVLPNAWYLDGGRIPTCIAVEAGQADLFLSGYLGIDFITRGLAVYRLLDAVVTFHRPLPRPGETIRYDIHIDRFFRQGETHLFRFRFEATVNGQPLLSMRDGCAGFFSAAELEAGKGIVRPALDLRPTKGILPADWRTPVPMGKESYDARQLDLLRDGDLAGCFGEAFAGLGLTRPLTIPGGRMRLVHRVTEIDPQGGRCGAGIIRAEADILPDDWFLTCHFVDDRVMPGTLMYECCMHTIRIYLLRMGWVAEDGEAAWEPVPGVASQLRCRGQVLETTKVAGYEVTIRELGYRPEPYAIVDALMYADGKPIVEITGMSVRLAGTTKEKIEALWSSRGSALPLSPSHKGRGDASVDGMCTERDGFSPSPLVGEGRGEGEGEGAKKPALYTKEQILAYSNGKPSEGFGEPYRIFDGEERKIARLPGPPYQFLDRVVALRGEPWKMVAGAHVEAEYDVPRDEWYFGADRQPRMPFAVLLEVALQPCGWLAAYVGSALTSPTDISFRNLGGTAVLHRPVTPETGTLTATATMKKVATSGGMIIQEFDFRVSDANGVVYDGETMFGFFSKEALANQVGVRDAALYVPNPEEENRGQSLDYPDAAPFPEKMLRMVDRIELYVPDGGRHGLGYLRGTKNVDPGEWFFAAHFYQDPVTPGSLGLEGFLQLVKFAAVERFGWREGDGIAVTAPERKHRWLYRGQVVPTNSRVTIEATITAVDEAEQTITADGLLSVDGRVIYQMNDFTVRMERQHEV